MAENIFTRLRNDLLNLEIKTILTEHSPKGDKMPSNFREAFYKLAGKYHVYMKEIGKKLRMDIRGRPFWVYGGLYSFEELKEQARKGIADLGKRIESETDDRKERTAQPTERGSGEGRAAPRDRVARMKVAKRMLERIVANSEQMISIFKELEAKEPKDSTGGEGDAPLDSKTESGEPAPPHEASKKWNNDIPLKSIQGEKDLPLESIQILVLRKAWNISTAEIVMQTTIEIDGDVTTRIMRGFAEHPNKTVLDIHNQCIEMSVGMWETLAKTAANLAGGALKGLFGKSR